jgi:hypothetical protein
MNYPDFSSIFPYPNVNYPCTFNPNSGYAADCIGTNQIYDKTINNIPQPTLLPPVEKSFTLYNWALPITIPSILTTDQTKKGNPPDKYISKYWIQPPYVPNPTFSDLYPDKDPSRIGQPFSWVGFNQALSKCIELDGSVYPPSDNICSSTNNDINCVDPLLAYPNKKPSCYGVSVQSDYIGNIIQDTSSYNLNYFLVEEPNSSPSSSLDLLNNTIKIPFKPKWIDNNKIDNNYLFCQPLFYTWIKNTPSGTPYNSTPSCTPVICPNGPIVCPPGSTSKCIPCTPVTCPIGSPRTNFDISSCPGPVYTQNQSNDPQYIDLNPPPSFFEDSPDFVPIYKARPPPSKSELYKNYIIGGVIVILLGLIYYFVFGPGSEGDIIIPLKKTAKRIKTIGKKIGGYFFYNM